MRGEGGLMGLSTLKAAARLAGVPDEAANDHTLKRVLRKHAAGGGGEVSFGHRKSAKVLMVS